MDQVDEQILRFLREDSRQPNAELARKLNMSESAVRRRITNLLKGGVVRKFTVEIDDSHLTSAITWVSVNPSVPTNQVSNKIKEVEGVEAVLETAGQFDAAVLIRGANIGEVNKSVERIRRIAGIVKTNTMMILRTIR